MRIWVVEFQDEGGKPYQPVGPWFFNKDAADGEALRRKHAYPDFTYRVRQYERCSSPKQHGEKP